MTMGFLYITNLVSLKQKFMLMDVLDHPLQYLALP